MWKAGWQSSNKCSSVCHITQSLTFNFRHSCRCQAMTQGLMLEPHTLFSSVFSFIKSAHPPLTLPGSNHKAWLLLITIFFSWEKRARGYLSLTRNPRSTEKSPKCFYYTFPICASFQSLKHACRTGTTGMVWQPHTRPVSMKLPLVRRRQSRLRIWCDLFPSLNLFLAFWLTAQDWRNLRKIKIQIVCPLCCSTWCSQCIFWPSGDEGSLCKTKLMNTVW